jgi:hypothetical protein
LGIMNFIAPMTLPPRELAHPELDLAVGAARQFT